MKKFKAGKQTFNSACYRPVFTPLSTSERQKPGYRLFSFVFKHRCIQIKIVIDTLLQALGATAYSLCKTKKALNNT